MCACRLQVGAPGLTLTHCGTLTYQVQNVQQDTVAMEKAYTFVNPCFAFCFIIY